MDNLELIGTKILKYLSGTSKNGIQSRLLWTSEDVGNPVYSKKKPLSIKELEKIFIKDRLELGLKDFDKAARIGFGVVRLHPTYGIAMNAVDMMLAIKDKDENEFFSNMFGGMGKATTKFGGNTANPVPTNNPRVNFRNRRAKPLGLPIKGIGYLMSALDYINDAIDLYNTIKE